MAKLSIGDVTDIAGTGAGIAGTIGSWLGIGEGRQDRRQVEQQRKLTDVQLAANEKSLEQQRKKEMQVWEDTNYSAQVEQAKKAGLSIGYLMSKGGGTSATMGGSGMSVAGGTAADAASTQQAGTQQAMAAAQIANLEADTNLKNANANKTAGVDTERGKQEIKESEFRIKDITQGIENKAAEKLLTEAQQRLTTITADTAEGSQADVLADIEATAKIAKARLEQEQNNAFISTRTKRATIARINAESIGAALENAIKRAEVKKKGAETDAIVQKVKQEWASISQGWIGLNQGQQQIDQGAAKVKTEQFKATVDANYPSISEAVGRWVDDGMNALYGLGGKERKVYKGIKE